MTQLVKYPMFQTFTSDTYNMTKEEIVTDAVLEIQKMIMGYTDGEREMLGIGKDFLESENLYELWDNDKIRFHYKTDSMRNNPTYNISMDADNSGIFVNLFHPDKQGVGYQPTKNRALSKNISYEDVRQEYNDKAWKSWFSNNVSKKEFFSQGDGKVATKGANGFVLNYGYNKEEEKQLFDRLKGVFDLTLNAQNKGKNGINDLIRMFNDIDFLPDINVPLETVERITQDRQQDFLRFIEQDKQGVFDDMSISKFKGGEETALGMTEIADNMFYDLVTENEGGFFAQAYDSGYQEDRNKTFNVGVRGVGGGVIEMAAEGSKMHKAEYDLMLSEKGDPTIGTGISINKNKAGGKRNIKLLEDLGYNIDNLLNGTEKLSIEDNQKIVMGILQETLELTERMVGMDLQTNENSYLALALVDLAYNSPSWIGKRFKKALEMYNKTGDMKYIGDFGSYNKTGQGLLIYSKNKKYDNYDDLEKNYEPALLNELWNDANSQAKINNMGGFVPRFEKVAGLIMAWSQGKYTYFPELNKIKSGKPLDSQ
tara:strand:- start:1635 stop:3254 length:1620 start_codon:yes stop_codon:yes gene_type:complete